jgi:prepilin-type N-terminal cleavage/methylation domain-containing protein
MNHKNNISKNIDYPSRMNNHLCSAGKKISSPGFTIVELLLALAIAAMLMVGVATAINASFFNYRENENTFKAINSARQALLRITSEIRTADAADPNAPANECTLITSNGADITYRYNNADNKLYLITNDDLTDPDYVLCDNITAMTFTRQTFVENFQTKVRSVLISITVQQGNTEKKIAAAAVIRRNMTW